MSTKVSFVAVLLLALCAALAAAEAPSYSSSADLAFLKSLAQAEGDGPVIYASAFKACTVSNECGDGNTVSCTGNSSCQTTIAGVKCDGHETQCPNFCTAYLYCDCCSGPYNTVCWSRRGDCQYTGNGISCDGLDFTCENTCPFCPEW